MRWVILCCVRLIIWAVSISCESYHDVYHCPEPQYIPVWVYSTGLATETWEGLLRELRHCLPRNNLHNLIFILWLSVNYHWQKVYEFPTYQNKTSVFVLKLLCHRCEACPTQNPQECNPRHQAKGLCSVTLLYPSILYTSQLLFCDSRQYILAHLLAHRPFPSHYWAHLFSLIPLSCPLWETSMVVC